MDWAAGLTQSELGGTELRLTSGPGRTELGLTQTGSEPGPGDPRGRTAERSRRRSAGRSGATPTSRRRRRRRGCQAAGATVSSDVIGADGPAASRPGRRHRVTGGWRRRLPAPKRGTHHATDRPAPVLARLVPILAPRDQGGPRSGRVGRANSNTVRQRWAAELVDAFGQNFTGILATLAEAVTRTVAGRAAALL